VLLDQFDRSVEWNKHALKFQQTLRIITRKDPTVTGLSDFKNNTVASLLAPNAKALELSDVQAAAVVSAPAPATASTYAGIRPRQPAITKCNHLGNNVRLFLTSMYTSVSTLTFTNDKQKAHHYVNNLTDDSTDTLFAIQDPVAVDA
jgi:hypothetical protein